MKSEVFRGADGDETLSVRDNRAGIHNVERERGPGGEGLRERNRGLVKLTRAVGVRVECGDGKGDVAAGDANLLPVKRRRYLQWDTGQRSLAIVAHGDNGPDGDLMRCSLQMHVEVEDRAGNGFAIGVLRGRLLGHFDQG